ncbi:MAG: EamA family transporter RarD [Lachnospiraceae bacterium]|nr:EamA family transporter RarD [Lachnospiraceae bacterium]
MKNEKKQGVFLVTLSYVLWGVLPIFWKLLEEVDSFYVLGARVVWSVVFCVLYLTILRKWGCIREILKDKKTVLRCGLCGVMVCINWGGYIWGVNNGHLIDCSFGYYLNPILVVLLGVFIFRERLAKMEWLAVILASTGVIYLIIRTGTVPVLAVLVGGSFALYGMMKKGLSIGSDESLFLETLLVSPIALIYLIVQEIKGAGAVGVLQGWEWILLPLAGVITAVPLLVYAAGVKIIPFYLTGILMYLNPTIQFLIGVFLYKEPMDADKLWSFVFIWIGILVMLIYNIRAHRKTSEETAV